MKVIVCLDDENGMLFCNRRQSRDRVVYERIVQRMQQEKTKLWIDPYSAELFSQDSKQVCCTPDLLHAAGKDDYCFVENVNLEEAAGTVAEWIIFRWDRLYPSDVKFLPEWLCGKEKRNA